MSFLRYDEEIIKHYVGIHKHSYRVSHCQLSWGRIKRNFKYQHCAYFQLILKNSYNGHKNSFILDVVAFRGLYDMSFLRYDEEIIKRFVGICKHSFIG